MEGVIILIMTASLFYVAPYVMRSVENSQAIIVTNSVDVGNNTGLVLFTGRPGVLGSSVLNASQSTIGTTAAGSLNLSVIGLIMLGVALMIAGFMLIRGRK